MALAASFVRTTDELQIRQRLVLVVSPKLVCEDVERLVRPRRLQSNEEESLTLMGE